MPENIIWPEHVDALSMLSAELSKVGREIKEIARRRSEGTEDPVAITREMTNAIDRLGQVHVEIRRLEGVDSPGGHA